MIERKAGRGPSSTADEVFNVHAPHADSPSLHPATFLAAGTRLGRYELIRRLAVGGMAELYLARAIGIEGFEKLVVLKRILPQYAESEDFVAMFLDEARLAATIQHANVAQVYDIGRCVDGLYFTMEYVHGEDLRAVLSASARRGTSLPLPHALTIAIGAAAGLHAAHELTAADGTPLGLVHRDVSPSNVLIAYSGCVKMIDFGVAKAARRQTETRAGTLKGKVAYMSPEQCTGGQIDRRSDVFSLGILLWEMTVGRRLYVADNEYALLRQIVDQDAPRPSSRKASYPPALEAIVMRALDRKRDQRYATAQDLQLDLEELARSQGLAPSSVQLGKHMRVLFPDRVGERPDPTQPLATGTPPRMQSPILSAQTPSEPPSVRGERPAPPIELVAGYSDDLNTEMHESSSRVEGAPRAQTWMFTAAPVAGGLLEPGVDLGAITRQRRRRAWVFGVAAAGVLCTAIVIAAVVALVRMGRTPKVVPPDIAHSEPPVTTPAPPIATEERVTPDPPVATIPPGAMTTSASELENRPKKKLRPKKKAWDPNSALPPP